MSINFFDRTGAPVAYTDDGEHLYTFAGKPVGYFFGDSLYSYQGAHLGRMQNGLLRDNRGDVVFFSPGATGGPLKPTRRLLPLKGLKQLKPLKRLKQMRPLRPLSRSSWSGLSGQQFFL